MHCSLLPVCGQAGQFHLLSHPPEVSECVIGSVSGWVGEARWDKEAQIFQDRIHFNIYSKYLNYLHHLIIVDVLNYQITSTEKD